MRRYYLVRHGETDLNVSGVFYGHTDCPINEKGEAQAITIGKSLAEVKFHRVFVSPLARAIRTKDLILAENQHNQSYKTQGLWEQKDFRLKEISCGRWETKSTDEIKQMDPEAWAMFTEGWPEAKMPEGESFMDLFRRMKEFFVESIEDEAIGTEDTEENILVVGHHGSIGILLLLCLGLNPRDYWKFRVEQGVYSLVTGTPGQLTLEKINTSGKAV